MFDELYEKEKKEYDYQKITDEEEIKKILKLYLDKYLKLDSKDEWFENIKKLSENLGYAKDMKDYKDNPDNYKGNVADISTVLRVALTTRSMTPDLYEIMKILGKEKVVKRYNQIINN